MFPPQHQQCQPGIENIMIPRPISNNPSYVGSGKLEGKVSIITGGDSGIGRAIAYIFAKEGADVVISYFNEHDDANETKAVLPCLKKGASIINTASITAYRGEPLLIDYSATKGAVVSFTRSLSASLVSKGIRVNAVAPGPIWTH